VLGSGRARFKRRELTAELLESSVLAAFVQPYPAKVDVRQGQDRDLILAFLRAYLS
jgi:hypothetical protein